MVTKTITITETAYNLLKRKKRPDESFSDLITRFFGENVSIVEFYGAWEGDDEEWSEIWHTIQIGWKNWNIFENSLD
ncbi:MAG TPA: antitoxin VapB family protein [Candidatus Lokiarchaeia archaeon]|nr:antitoxin VapB family protein [Candidatus Lokiarchaeia archaeon]